MQFIRENPAQRRQEHTCAIFTVFMHSSCLGTSEWNNWKKQAEYLEKSLKYTRVVDVIGYLMSEFCGITRYKAIHRVIP